jgi:glycosyltransferase involved in cell wall biosynthesis
MTKPRLAFIITDCDFGGAEQVLSALCKGLKGDFDIRVLTLKRKGHFAKLIEAEGIEVRSLGLGEKVGLTYLFKLPIALFKTWLDLKKFKPDIAQGILFQGNLFARLAGKTAGVPSVLCALHTFEESVFKNALENMTSSLARQYVVVSGALKNFLSQKCSIPPERITVIRNGIDLSILSPSQDDASVGKMLNRSGPVIGAIARLHREKGIDLLIRSFYHLAKNYPEATLMIIGDGPERQNLEKLCESLGPKKKIVFTGFQPDPHRYFCLFDIFALASRTEAMPITLMQAMAWGLPVVATRVGGVSELIEDGEEGLLVPAEDEFLLTRSMSLILKDGELGKMLGANAQARALREFSLDKMIRAYKDLYLGLVKGEG